MEFDDLIEEIHYSFRFSPELFISGGAHRVNRSGGGTVFSGHATILEQMNPSRIDPLKTKLARDDLFRVKTFEEETGINLIMVADLSASMLFTGVFSRQTELARLAASFAHSAYLRRDPFGFIGCADKPLDEFILNPDRNRSYSQILKERLLCRKFDNESSGGLAAIGGLLPSRRSLVLIVSDFHFEDLLIRRIMGSLSGHDAVPIVLWDPLEYDAPEIKRFWRVVRLSDPESGGTRLMIWRKKTVEAQRRLFRRRERELIRIFADFGSEPLFIVGRADSRKISAYFEKRGR